MPVLRKHLIFYGTVQNVGFRYEMTRLAQHHGLTGWVKNRSDGTVEACIQGSADSIRHTIDELNSIDHIHIVSMDEESVQVVDGESRFVTRYTD
jgi:acylphosphatase